MSYLLLGVCCVVIIVLLICVLRYSEKQKYKALKKEREKNMLPVKCQIG